MPRVARTKRASKRDELSEPLELDENAVRTTRVARAQLDAAIDAHLRAIETRDGRAIAIAKILDAAHLVARRQRRGERENEAALQAFAAAAEFYLDTRRPRERWAGEALPLSKGSRRKKEAVQTLLRHCENARATLMRAPLARPIIAGALLGLVRELGLGGRERREDDLASRIRSTSSARALAIHALQATGVARKSAEGLIDGASGT